MKKTGFTLAEVLITLMILGVIAAMTVPTLIQDTQKKEQVVQMKKGLSMVNQAVTMNYALEQENLADIAAKSDAVTEVIKLMKKRLAVIDSGEDWVTTSDGLTYFWELEDEDCRNAEEQVANNGANACYNLIIFTKPINSGEKYTDADGAEQTIPAKSSMDYTVASNLIPKAEGTASPLTGVYQFYAGADRVIPSYETQAIMNAKDLKKLKGEDLAQESET